MSVESEPNTSNPVGDVELQPSPSRPEDDLLRDLLRRVREVSERQRFQIVESSESSATQ